MNRNALDGIAQLMDALLGALPLPLDPLLSSVQPGSQLLEPQLPAMFHRLDFGTPLGEELLGLVEFARFASEIPLGLLGAGDETRLRGTRSRRAVAQIR